MRFIWRPSISQATRTSQETASGMIMIDPGSDTNFVRHEFAQAIGLLGEECQFRLKVVDRDARPTDDEKIRTLEIEDKEGNRHSVSSLGLDSITVLPPRILTLPQSKDLVKHIPPAVLDRPQGRCRHSPRIEELRSPW